MLGVKYAHLTEELFAVFLRSQGISFLYEPKEFVLIKDLTNGIRKSFVPDFYLPDFQLYLEITALKNKLVNKKRLKLKMARALYPEYRFEILYKTDLIEILINQNVSHFYKIISGSNSSNDQ